MRSLKSRIAVIEAHLEERARTLRIRLDKVREMRIQIDRRHAVDPVLLAGLASAKLLTEGRRS